jgi:hypothetical protein
MYVVSWDIASKSLAVSIIYFNHNWVRDLKLIHLEFNKYVKDCTNPIDIYKYTIQVLDEIDKLLDNMIQPIFLDVVDLIPGQKLKDTTVILRTSRLKAYLSYIDNKLNELEGDIQILLEYQMGPNDKSRNVCSQILYHYSNNDFDFSNTSEIKTEPSQNLVKYNIEIVGPSLKNKINFNPDKPYSYFTKKYVKLYDANKNHSKENLLYWLKEKKIEHMIKNIKKKNLDDIADSVNMTLAWLRFKSNLL